MILKSGLNTLIAGSGFVLTFYTLIVLALFLSQIPPEEVRAADTLALKLSELKGQHDGRLLATVASLIVNISLLIVFLLQHSVLANPSVKQWIYGSGWQVVERSIYIITTSGALLLLLKFWQPIPWVVLWNVNTWDNPLLWWFFTILHTYMWVTIYGGCIMRDVLELLGVKQVYYDVIGLQSPLSYKSAEMCRLYQHQRHPSFVGFCVLFWVCPFMTFDRFLLSIVWTLYMMIVWNANHLDYNYQERQLGRKESELART